MLYAPINCGSSGDNTVVAGVFGKRIRVVAFLISFSGTVNAKWRSNATDLTGPYYGTAAKDTQGAPMPEGPFAGPEGHLETAQGEALNLNLSGATAVGGHVAYVLFP